MIELELPYPPSVNHTHRKVRGRVILSTGARDYRKAVCEALAAAGSPKLAGALAVQIEAFPPDDGNRHDMDNIQKALLDSLQYAGLYADDHQIDEISVTRRKQFGDGAVIVRVKRIR